MRCFDHRFDWHGVGPQSTVWLIRNGRGGRGSGGREGNRGDGYIDMHLLRVLVDCKSEPTDRLGPERDNKACIDQKGAIVGLSSRVSDKARELVPLTS